MIRLLLDTHVFYWWCAEDPRLPESVRDSIAGPGSQVFVSTVTAWELVLKQRLGKIDLPPDLRSNPGKGIIQAIEASDFEPLLISFEHVEHLLEVPQHHKDPFDHMLVAQARLEDLTLVTHDKALGLYGIPVLWA